MVAGFRFRDRAAATSGIRIDGVPRVSAQSFHLVVGILPLGSGWIAIGAVALEDRAVLNRSDLHRRIRGVAGRTGLCNGGTCGKSGKRQEKPRFHGSLDVEARARSARNRRAQGASRMQQTSERERWTIESRGAGVHTRKIRLRSGDGRTFTRELRLDRSADRRGSTASRAGPAMSRTRNGIVAVGETRFTAGRRFAGVTVLVAAGFVLPDDGLDRLGFRGRMASEAGTMVLEHAALTCRHGQRALDGHGETHDEQQQKSEDRVHVAAILAQLPRLRSVPFLDPSGQRRKDANQQTSSRRPKRASRRPALGSNFGPTRVHLAQLGCLTQFHLSTNLESWK